MGLQELLGLQEVLPADVPRMIVQQQNTPLRHRLFLTVTLPGPPVNNHGLSARAAIDQRSGITRIAEHLMDAMLAGQAPADVPTQGPRAHLRQRQLRLTIPEHGLAGTTQLPK